MILYINRFYIAMCVLRSISQYIGLMLKDVHLHVGFYYKKSVGPPVYDLFISICNWKRGKQGYKIFFEVFFLFKKKIKKFSKVVGVVDIRVYSYSMKYGGIRMSIQGTLLEQKIS